MLDLMLFNGCLRQLNFFQFSFFIDVEVETTRTLLDGFTNHFGFYDDVKIRDFVEIAFVEQSKKSQPFHSILTHKKFLSY